MKLRNIEDFVEVFPSGHPKSDDKIVYAGDAEDALNIALAALPWEKVTDETEWDEEAKYLCSSKNGMAAGSWFYYRVYYAEGKWWEDDDGILFTAMNKHYEYRIRITPPEGEKG